MKGRVFNESIYGFMVFNKYKVIVSRGVWEKGVWKIKGEFNIDNFIIDI